MNRPRVALFAAGLAAAAAAIGWLASPAAAQAGCATGGIQTQATVDIDAPAPNSTVTGTVNVRGTATTPLVVGSVARVEVTFAGVTKTQTFSPSSNVTFNVPFDTTTFSPGAKSITVVACGALTEGSASISVNVPAPTTTTTAVSSGTTVASTPPASAQAGATTTVVGQAAPAGGPTTTVAGPTTTVTSSPPSTEAPAEPVVVPARPTTTRGDSRADAPLVLTEAPDDEGSGAPLWVGAVVGISGGLGLLFSAVSWRRRANLPEPMEPIDPELVDVGSS